VPKEKKYKRLGTRERKTAVATVQKTGEGVGRRVTKKNIEPRLRWRSPVGGKKPNKESNHGRKKKKHTGVAGHGLQGKSSNRGTIKR